MLQSGKRGGVEAADRLSTEVSNYLQQHGDAKYWEIMVHLYIDIGRLLARCVSSDIPLSDDNVRDFMIGFTQAKPLFTIVDVGHDPGDLLSRKVEGTSDSPVCSIANTYLGAGMFHLFAHNVQCKHLIFGCCNNSAYAVALEPYASNPITASSITLLKSYESNTYFEGLPFDLVEFPHVFRSTPFKVTDRLAEEVDYMQDLPQQPGSGNIMSEAKKSSADEVAEVNEALAKWQAAANASIPLRARVYPQVKVHSGSAIERNILLNIKDERVDPELGEVDYDTSESMLDRMEELRFCAFYHLQDCCVAKSLGQHCKFRHGPRLNNDELRFLKQNYRRMPCNFGSRCRKPDCLYGHVCADQPGCEKGQKCRLYRFHDVDKTAVRVWSIERIVSPQKKGWRGMMNTGSTQSATTD